MIRTFVFPLAAILALLLGGPSRAVEPAATPQRPSLATNVWTVPAGRVEVEAGATFGEGAGALPVLAKVGWTDALEVFAGVDAVRWVDGPGDGTTSLGDLVLGGRWRPDVALGEARFAVAGAVKIPTADDDAGSGETDAALTGILSVPLPGGAGLDVNLVATALGRDGGGTLGQGQGIVALGFPLAGRWSGFVEGAYQRTAGEGDGTFWDAGLAYAATPRAVLDVAAGVGASDGYPDWSVSIGWTVLFARGGP